MEISEYKYKESENHIITAKNVFKYYKKFLALRDVSFGVTKGKIHGFIGPNGAGKTTTIKSIIGALKYQKGSITINNFASQSIPAKELISYIPENARFPTKMTIDSYLLHMARLYGYTKKQAQEKLVVNWEKNAMGIKKFRKQDPNSLSSGQKKKVYLMQALITSPQILIMDEPAANLDPDARIEFFSTLSQIRKQGYTVFISSHVLSELNDVVDEITVLEKGRVIFTGEIKKLKFLENQYIIDTSNNKSFMKVLPKGLLPRWRKNKTIMVEISNDEQIKSIYKSAVKHDILLRYMKPNEVNLTEIYTNILETEYRK